MGDGLAAVIDWGTFTEIWDDLWYPFDWMCVFDDTNEWAVLFGPGEIARFAEKSPQRLVH
jgi:hypothetical protein